MKLTLQPTGQYQTIKKAGGEIETRVWQGTDEHGTPVKAWIVTVSPQTHDPEANERFARELREVQVERQLVSFDMRML